jgi:hypothetical protein
LTAAYIEQHPNIAANDSKNGCALAVPLNTVPNLVLIAIQDFKRGDRALVPVLNLPQDD